MVDCDPWYLSLPEKLGPTLVGIAALVVTYFTVRLQIRVSTVSTSRRQWIDSLLEVVSDFFPRQLALVITEKLSEQSEQVKALDEYGRLDTRLRLMLDPNDSAHAELLNAVEELGKNLWKVLDKPGSKDYTTSRERVIVAARKVVANEWSKIKQGK